MRCDIFSILRGLSVTVQHGQAVLVEIAGGARWVMLSPSWGVGAVCARGSSSLLGSWLGRFANRSHELRSMPHLMPAHVEAALKLPVDATASNWRNYDFN